MSAVVYIELQRPFLFAKIKVCRWIPSSFSTKKVLHALHTLIVSNAQIKGTSKMSSIHDQSLHRLGMDELPSMLSAILPQSRTLFRSLLCMKEYAFLRYHRISFGPMVYSALVIFTDVMLLKAVYFFVVVWVFWVNFSLFFGSCRMDSLQFRIYCSLNHFTLVCNGNKTSEIWACYFKGICNCFRSIFCKNGHWTL